MCPRNDSDLGHMLLSQFMLKPYVKSLRQSVQNPVAKEKKKKKKKGNCKALCAKAQTQEVIILHKLDFYLFLYYGK